MFLVLPISGFSQELSTADVEGNASVSFMSNYVWRGQKLSDKAVLQPTVGISFKGFSANFWTNDDLDLKETTETDVTSEL